MFLFYVAKGKWLVVDERLRVYGTTNLRIVDSSVMPLISRGNIQTTAYAVAEKAVDIIKEDSFIASNWARQF